MQRIADLVHSTSKLKSPSHAFRVVAAIMLLFPGAAIARGGNAGGHGVSMHGGGMHGGPIGGPVGGPMGHPGFHGGIGPGFHSAAFRAPGWGYPGYHGYGWGYPYFGYGVGLGLGMGVGYGLAAGYGYPYYGYGYGYGPYYGTTTYVTASPIVPASATTTTVAASNPSKSSEFFDRGVQAFKTADYEGAAYAWRHAIVDDPRNPKLVLLLAQALFATGKYDEAAGATQAAMRQLPQEDWGAAVTQFKTLYGNAHDYTKQLQAMEKAIKANPESPALHFLAGYHFGYLGFYKQSVEQLERAIQIESRDEVSKRIRDIMRAKLGADKLETRIDVSLPPAPAPAPELNSTWTPTPTLSAP